MRRFVLGILAALFTTGTAHAQQFEERPRHRGPEFENGFFVNPFSLLAGQLNVGYERAVSQNTSVMLAGRVGRIEGTMANGDSYLISSAGAEVQPHFYLARRAPRGPYLAPFVGAGQAMVESEGDSFSQSYVTAGSTVGWSWVWGRFNLKLGLGGEYSYGPQVVREDGQTEIRTVGAPSLAGDLKMGLVF